MGVLLSAGMPVLVHNMTGAYAVRQIEGMRETGTNIVAGVHPGRGGSEQDGLPIFNTAGEAVAATGAQASVIYTPAPGVADAIIDHADAGIRLMVVAAEYVPVHDAMRCLGHARAKGAWVVGPNCVGMICPGIGMLGSMPAAFTMPGPVGLFSRSGTLSFTVSEILTRRGIGQTAALSIGGDAVIGRNAVEYLELFAEDPQTRAIAYCGEIGGTQEYAMAERLPALGRPLVALIVGRHAPPGRRMGHAGALVSHGSETAEAKRAALAAAGALIADDPYHMAELLLSVL